MKNLKSKIADTTQKETEDREKRIWKELAKDGIHNEEELDKAIKNMKLLNIGGFVNKLEVKNNEIN